MELENIVANTVYLKAREGKVFTKTFKSTINKIQSQSSFVKSVFAKHASNVRLQCDYQMNTE
jgi:hypothetical protein